VRAFEILSYSENILKEFFGPPVRFISKEDYR